MLRKGGEGIWGREDSKFTRGPEETFRVMDMSVILIAVKISQVSMSKLFKCTCIRLIVYELYFKKAVY